MGDVTASSPRAGGPQNGARFTRAVGDALVAVCRGDAPDIPEDPGFAEDLVAALRHHRIAPLAHVRLRQAFPAESARLLTDRYAALNTHVRAAATLADAGRALGEIPWATFKGPVLSEFAHPVRGLRTYHDLDLLVPPTSMREVASRLLESNWRVADDEGFFHIPGELPGEMHWWAPNGVLVDLHWTVLNQASVRSRHTVPTGALLAGRRAVQILGSPAYALDPIDAFVHVCFHAAESGAHRLLLLLDVHELARLVDDWNAVADRARSWRAGPEVALVLHRARAVLGTPLPGDVGRLLGVSPAFVAITGAANALEPVPRIRREATFARLVARSARPGTARTVLAITGKTLQWAWGQLPWVEPRSLVEGRPAQAASVDAFLERVESAARHRSDA